MMMHFLDGDENCRSADDDVVMIVLSNNLVPIGVASLDVGTINRRPKSESSTIFAGIMDNRSYESERMLPFKAVRLALRAATVQDVTN